jgi:SAM-dependent methyltransferase
MRRILEIGASDVNGSLRDFKPENCEWVGIDLAPGKGVDLVIEKASRLPFENDYFDLVIATSVFEHDSTFWLTFLEMLRVIKPAGFIYICAPSNGWVHRYPIDAYRFYPDAGIALVEWGRMTFPEIELVESFIAERDGDVWNDFCAVFSKSKTNHSKKIHRDTRCSNIWSDGVFQENTLTRETEDLRLYATLAEELKLISQSNQSVTAPDELTKQNLILESDKADLSRSLVSAKNELASALSREISLNQRIKSMEQSISWRITSPLRNIKSWIRK